jgi:hypothetical protein
MSVCDKSHAGLADDAPLPASISGHPTVDPESMMKWISTAAIIETFQRLILYYSWNIRPPSFLDSIFGINHVVTKSRDLA